MLGSGMFLSGCTELVDNDTFGDLQNDAPHSCSIIVQEGTKNPCYSNYSLSEAHSDVTRAVIIAHGTDRNARDYLDTVIEAAELAGKEGETVVIAPHFQTINDAAREDELQWSSSGWKEGNKSLDKNGLVRVSSFDVVDKLVEILFDRSIFPNLKDIVVTGHSAGGQFVQRYAAGTQVDLSQSAYSFKFVVANPGSYLYLDGYRWNGGAYIIPQPEDCAYDDYKYGMLNRNDYMGRLPENDIIGNYCSRKVVYLLGDQDVVVDDNLDTGCEASLQGTHRYERGQTYMNHLNTFYNYHAHSQVDVPGAGHSRTEMYESAFGLEAIFDK